MDTASTITCTACQQTLTGVEARHTHYRSDIHRVNLKRKVGGLPPLSINEFHTRLAALEASKNESSKQREVHFCNACSKRFSSVKALDNHTKSRRHLDRVARLHVEGMEVELSSVGGTDTETVSEVWEEDDDAVDRELERRLEEGFAMSERECVFDGSEHENVEENLKYMASSFGFFLPFVERIRDVEGLLRYLGQKVGIGFACVMCDKPFSSVRDAQRHMIDKSHCRMRGNEEEWVDEFGEFYDFEHDDDEWEEVDEEEAAQLEKAQEENQLVALDNTGQTFNNDDLGQEVGLAVNGKVLGHRSLQRYYKQNLGYGEDSRAAVVANRVMKEYRLLGWSGTVRNANAVKQNRQSQRHKQRFELVVGNKNYYTRKAQFKQKMAVFNSGYRA